jgi:ABC-type multidrug transport system ATPase subunit
LHDATLSVPAGCLFGLVGPDGAGKTTLFRLITTLMLPDAGQVTVFGNQTGRDYRKIRKFTGYMPGRFSLYPDLTVEENLSFYATIFGTTVVKNYALIEPIYALLAPFKKRLARDLSGGMKQKLALSCALIHNPRLLVLDEPTTGVDAVSRKEFWDTLHMLKSSGMTILVSTPYMDEAVRCDRVAMIQNGVIITENSPENIRNAFGKLLFEISSADRFGVLQYLRSLAEIRGAYLFGKVIHATLEKGESRKEWLASRLKEQGFADARIEPAEADFEDCFIEAVESKSRYTHEQR